MAQGTYGKIRIWDDFLNLPTSGSNNHGVWETGIAKVGNFGFLSVNEGSWAATVDEPGGIVAITTDGGDNDNAVLVAGTFVPSNGGILMECRFKFAHLTTSIFAGFTETLAAATPVMPAEFDGTTMTYNGSGGMIGLQYDVDGTTDDWRAVGADGGAATGTTRAKDTVTAGIRAQQTIAADEWYVVRVEVNPDGTGRCYVGHDGGLSGNLQLVADYVTAPITSTDVFYAVLMIENRAAAARALEVDYMNVEGWRDWTVT